MNWETPVWRTKRKGAWRTKNNTARGTRLGRNRSGVGTARCGKCARKPPAGSTCRKTGAETRGRGRRCVFPFLAWFWWVARGEGTLETRAFFVTLVLAISVLNGEGREQIKHVWVSHNFSFAKIEKNWRPEMSTFDRFFGWTRAVTYFRTCAVTCWVLQLPFLNVVDLLTWTWCQTSPKN